MFEDCGTVDPKIAYHVSLVSILIRLIVGVSPLLASQIGSKVVPQDNLGELCMLQRRMADAQEILIFKIGIGR